MIGEGFNFINPEFIMKNYQPGQWKGEIVCDDFIVKARGLPWNSTESDVANFFKGLNIEKGGVALCMYPQGRKNGEAMVRFETKEHRCMALKRHKLHLGSRYIEVFRATGKEFMQCLASGNKEAQALLMQKYDFIDPIIIRMRGLPYTCKESDVLEFFRAQPNKCDVLDGESGVLLIYQSEGRNTGDAFVLFANEDETTKALTKHKQCIGSRYIELFRSTVAEIQQVLQRNFDPRLASFLMTSTSPIIPHISFSYASTHLKRQVQNMAHTLHTSSGISKDCIRLSGIPQNTSINDVIVFLSDHVKDIKHQGIHLVHDSQGGQTEEVLIEMVGERQADFLQENKNGKMILVSGNRHYVSAHRCSLSEMMAWPCGINGNPITHIPSLSTDSCPEKRCCSSGNKYRGNQVNSLPSLAICPPVYLNYLSPFNALAMPPSNNIVSISIPASTGMMSLSKAIKEKVKI